MSKIYDYVIIGGGPAGLTLAWCLSKYNKKVAIIDKNESIGGCHRVHRVNGLFSEHGPRIYIDNYVMFKKILKEMGLDFNDLFTPYKFNMTNIGGDISHHLSYRELYILAKKFINLNDSYQKISIGDFMKKNNFTDQAKDYIDRLCRMTDGAGSDRYTLYSFLQIANQNMLHKIYQPKKPNDVALFKYWQEALLKKGVDIFLNSDAIDIQTENNIAKSIIIQNNKKHEIRGNNFIFAIPPYNISQFLLSSKNQKIKDAFGNYDQFIDWSKKTNYLQYIPITFHFNQNIKLKKIWGFPSTKWGIGFVVMSDYMEFENPNSKIVISALVTKNEKSDYTNKTPNETNNEEELKQEVFRQLKISFPNLPNPTYSILSQNYYDENKKEWIPKDTSFIKTKFGYIDNKSPKFLNLYNCGVSNGNSEYSFTSIESAICNAITLLHDLEPKAKYDYKIKTAITVISLLEKILIFIIVWTIYFIIIKTLLKN
jgi:hypothetical protein